MTKLPVVQMDLDEWEVLPDDGFVEINSSSSSSSGGGSSVGVLEMNYFICPPTPTPPEINNISTRGGGGGGGGDQDLNEFVDMMNKMDSLNNVNIPQIQFEEEEEELDDDDSIKKMEIQSAHNVWKRGIGAICSFAAAAFCIILFTHHPNNTHPPNQNLSFHNLIHHPTSRLPISTARITCGGYYDPSPPAAASL